MVGIAVIFLFFEYPILGKWIIGSARPIGKPISCEIKINGIEYVNAKIFRQTTDFYGTTDRDYLILFIPKKNKSNGRNVLVIDRVNNVIRRPNSNKRDYEIICNYLFQSESGANTMVPINDGMKGMGFDPNLKFVNTLIEFDLPVWSEHKISKVEIKLNAN